MDFKQVLEFMGRQLDSSLKPVIFFLEGPLGAGKTYLSRAFLESLGTKQNVVSPTFIISREIDTLAGKAYHLDFYRLREQMQENIEAILEQVNFWEILQTADIVLIEWGDLLYDYLKNQGFNLPMFKVIIHTKKDKRDYKVIH